jgi:predicted Fe-Mo cluster-binding NifX family protein
MILLIPTDDGISIASMDDKAVGFRYLNIENDEIKKNELSIFENFLPRFKKERKNGINKEATVITSGISNEMEKLFQNYNFEIIMTTEHNITNAVLKYLKEYALNESDYCCMP